MSNSLSRFFLVLGLAISCSFGGNSEGAEQHSCEPRGFNGDELRAWRSDGFPSADPGSTLLELLPCLSKLDPFLRDRIGYEGISSLLRGHSVPAASRRQFLQGLSQLLAASDETGVAAPFAVLALSEVVRSDRIDPFLDDGARAHVVDLAASYLSGVRDYRGLVDGEGWRHGVAHGADLALQLVLNPAVSDAQVKSLSKAVFSQVNGAGGHSYIFGEPQRLARPVLYGALRQTIEAEHWQQLFAKIADPGTLGEWASAFDSELGMAQLHNTRAFAQAVYLAASTSGRKELEVLMRAAESVLSELP